MLIEEHMFEDSLLPELDTLSDFIEADEEETIPETQASRGLFSDSPENASRWIEGATRRFVVIN